MGSVILANKEEFYDEIAESSSDSMGESDPFGYMDNSNEFMS